MSTVLVIETSIRQRESISRKLTEDFLARWRDAHPEDRIVRRDLAKAPLPHLDETLLSAWSKAAAALSADEQAALLRADQLTDELLAADVLVLAAPMYNFAIPSTLKAWFDHVLRAGITFQYGENGAQGLLHNRRAFVLCARGGLYEGNGLDQQQPYLRQALGFIGIRDVRFISADGLDMGADCQQKGLERAFAQLAQAL